MSTTRPELAPPRALRDPEDPLSRARRLQRALQEDAAEDAGREVVPEGMMERLRNRERGHRFPQ